MTEEANSNTSSLLSKTSN